MPLLPGASNIGPNIHELEVNGSRPRPRAQMVAIALHEAGKSKAKPAMPAPPSEDKAIMLRRIFEKRTHG